MGRMKRGISILLVFVICLLALQNDVGNVSASETGQEEWTVRLAQTEHGRVRFVSSDEDKNTGQDGDSLASSGEDTDEETKAYRTGDKVALEIDPDKGFCVENIRILDAVTEEEISPEAVKEGQDKYSFVMGNQPVIVCVDFRLADEADEGTLEGASGEETIREGSDGENLETEYHFPQKGERNITSLPERLSREVYVLFEYGERDLLHQAKASELDIERFSGCIIGKADLY